MEPFKGPTFYVNNLIIVQMQVNKGLQSYKHVVEYLCQSVMWEEEFLEIVEPIEASGFHTGYRIPPQVQVRALVQLRERILFQLGNVVVS